MIWKITIAIVLAGIILALLPYAAVAGLALLVVIAQRFTKEKESEHGKND